MICRQEFHTQSRKKIYEFKKANIMPNPYIFFYLGSWRRMAVVCIKAESIPLLADIYLVTSIKDKL